MKIYSIFQSIDGEVNSFHQGRLSTFIRFGGCNLKCLYCDTQYAWEIGCGQEMSIQEVMAKVKKNIATKVTITGGEPLLQKDGLVELANELIKQGYDVSIETNGAIPMPKSLRTNPNICWVVDFKLPSSGEMPKMKFDFVSLTEFDFVKFVIKDWDDFIAADDVGVKLRQDGCKAQFAFSPVHGKLDPVQLMGWMIDAHWSSAIINLQLHKYLGLVEDK